MPLSISSRPSAVSRRSVNSLPLQAVSGWRCAPASAAPARAEASSGRTVGGDLAFVHQPSPKLLEGSVGGGERVLASPRARRRGSALLVSEEVLQVLAGQRGRLGEQARSLQGRQGTSGVLLTAADGGRGAIGCTEVPAPVRDQLGEVAGVHL